MVKQISVKANDIINLLVRVVRIKGKNPEGYKTFEATIPSKFAKALGLEEGDLMTVAILKIQSKTIKGAGTS